MFGRTPKSAILDLTPVTDKLLEELDQHDPDSEEFAKAMSHLERVVELTSRDKKSIDPNTVLITVGKFLGILVIVGYEHMHVVTSKALGFVGSDAKI